MLLLQIQILHGHSGNVTAINFHLQGKWVVTGSEDGTIKVWDLRCCTQGTNTCTYDPTNICCRSGQPQRTYDNTAPGTSEHCTTKTKWQNNINCIVKTVNDVVIHPNQAELISCDNAGSIKLWDLQENACMLDLVSEIKGEIITCVLLILILNVSPFPLYSFPRSKIGACRRRTHTVCYHRYWWLLSCRREQQGKCLCVNSVAGSSL